MFIIFFSDTYICLRQIPHYWRTTIWGAHYLGDNCTTLCWWLLPASYTVMCSCTNYLLPCNDSITNLAAHNSIRLLSHGFGGCQYSEHGLIGSSTQGLQRLQWSGGWDSSPISRLYWGRVPCNSGGCWQHSVPYRLLELRVSIPLWLLAEGCPQLLGGRPWEVALVPLPWGPFNVAASFLKTSKTESLPARVSGTIITEPTSYPFCHILMLRSKWCIWTTC